VGNGPEGHKQTANNPRDQTPKKKARTPTQVQGGNDCARLSGDRTSGCLRRFEDARKRRGETRNEGATKPRSNPHLAATLSASATPNARVGQKKEA